MEEVVREEVVSGLDTIVGLVGEPPKVIEIPYNLLKTETIAQQGWNAVHIAIIPYCYKCKEPLVWHIRPKGKILFHCPKCKCKWIKGKDWRK